MIGEENPQPSRGRGRPRLTLEQRMDGRVRRKSYPKRTPYESAAQQRERIRKALAVERAERQAREARRSRKAAASTQQTVAA